MIDESVSHQTEPLVPLTSGFPFHLPLFFNVNNTKGSPAELLPTSTLSSHLRKLDLGACPVQEPAFCYAPGSPASSPLLLSVCVGVLPGRFCPSLFSGQQSVFLLQVRVWLKHSEKQTPQTWLAQLS